MHGLVGECLDGRSMLAWQDWASRVPCTEVRDLSNKVLGPVSVWQHQEVLLGASGLGPWASEGCVACGSTLDVPQAGCSGHHRPPDLSLASMPAV